MKVTILTNIPSPYRMKFFNALGKKVDLTVIFEARRAKGINFNWNDDKVSNFCAIFLKDGFIEEKCIDIKILKYINLKDQDYIIVTNYGYYTEMLALLYIKIRRFPYILEIDGGIIRKENFFKKYIKNFLIANAKLYLSPSQTSDKYLMYYGAKKEHIHRYPFTSLSNNDILPCIIDESEKKIIRNSLNIKEEKIVLSVGQFIYRKGYDNLLKAAADIDKNVGIYIVGGIPTAEYRKLQEEYQLANVHFIEFKKDEILKKYYKAADIFVLPTREDIWGLVINEAMANALPVISTDKCTAALELIKNGENGFIVPTDDIQELYNKIALILNDDVLRKAMARKNLNIIKKYTIENMSAVHHSILKYFYGKAF